MKKLILMFSIALLASANAYAQDQQPRVEPRAESNPPNIEQEIPQAPEPDFVAPLKPMTVERIRQLILDLDDDAKVDGNVVEFTFANRTVVMIAAPQANRMRLVSGVIEAQQLSDDQLLSVLVSNYHLALDARYAVGNGVLFSVYVHPLAQLDEELLLSGIRQVATLAETFGTTYTSGELSFGRSEPEGEEI